MPTAFALPTARSEVCFGYASAERMCIHVKWGVDSFVISY
jgi:hypothetical protein